jgi:hypothetical protein
MWGGSFCASEVKVELWNDGGKSGERVNSCLGWSLAQASAADWSRTWLIAADRPEKMGRDL